VCFPQRRGWHTNERACLSAKSADRKVVGLDAIVHQTLAYLEDGVPKWGSLLNRFILLRFNGRLTGGQNPSCSFDDGVADSRFLLFDDRI